MNDNLIFTICIPTFNRGEKTLNLVKTILPKMQDKWEVLILNNNSDEEVDFYNKIKVLSTTNKHLRYVKNKINLMAHGNYLACFKNSKSDYIMTLSDEDFPNMDLLPKALDYLLANPKLAILRGSIELMPGVTDGNAITNQNEYYEAGEEALLKYALTNNYQSGTIYNKKEIQKNGFVDLLEQNLQKYHVYPHLYIEVLIITKLDAYRVSDVLSYVGPEQVTMQNGVKTSSPMIYQYPYSFGSRIDQFVDLRDALFEAVVLYNNNIELFVQLYMNLVWKYFHLISRVNMPLYKINYLSDKYIIDSFRDFACSAILSYPVSANYHEQIIQFIDNIHSNFKV